MNRRKFLFSAALPGLGGATEALPLLGGHPLKRRPPNVLFILTNDQGVGDVGRIGNPYLRTPSLDRLAQKGTSLKQGHRLFMQVCEKPDLTDDPLFIHQTDFSKKTHL